MHFIDFKSEIVQAVISAQGRFITAYQVCQILEHDHPDQWRRLVEAYPSADPDTPMGEGTGSQYSPATFVARALTHFTNTDALLKLHQESFSCEGVVFSGIAPGFTGNFVGIWAIRP
jgi:hypothetical protein